MKVEHIRRIQALQEKLIELALIEADPDNWPGAGIPLAEMTKQVRGDRYWCKKNAAATFALVSRCQTHIIGSPEDADEDIDEQIQAREKEAELLLQKALARAKKPA